MHFWFLTCFTTKSDFKLRIRNVLELQTLSSSSVWCWTLWTHEDTSPTLQLSQPEPTWWDVKLLLSGGGRRSGAGGGAGREAERGGRGSGSGGGAGRVVRLHVWLKLLWDSVWEFLRLFVKTKCYSKIKNKSLMLSFSCFIDTFFSLFCVSTNRPVLFRLVFNH